MSTIHVLACTDPASKCSGDEMIGRPQPSRRGTAETFDEFHAELAIEGWRVDEPWVGPKVQDSQKSWAETMDPQYSDGPVPDEPDSLTVDLREQSD